MTLYTCDLYVISIVRKWWEWMHACMNEIARHDSAQIVNNSKIDINGSEISIQLGVGGKMLMWLLI